MPSNRQFSNGVGSSELSELVDQACKTYAQQWHAGDGPRIESFLEQAPAAVRKEVLHQLLLLEVELTSGSSGHMPDMHEWLKRFPEYESVLRHVWSRIQETHVRCSDDTVLEVVSTSTRYSDLRHFRTGGMADLYLAHDSELRRDTVVKRLRDKFRHDPDYGKRLAIEAEITGRLDHPGVVPVYGIGEDWEGRPFYVMRMIRGSELQTGIDEYHAQGGLDKRGRSNRQRLLDLLEHVIAAANTVAFAHDAGIIHGDIKPMNIMIGRYGETFVVDWGLARTFQRTTEFRKAGDPQLIPREHIPPELRGFTLGYVSPEQFAGRDDIGPASDIYSLGATLYQILTNRTPLRGSELDYGDRLAYGEIPPPRSLNPRIPKALEAICQKAMQVAPEARYTTAKQFAADLRNWMHDEEVEAAPDSSLNRIRRWSRNHRVTTIGTLLTFTALLVAGVLFTSIAVKMNLAEQRFDVAIDTFEKLVGPFANLEQNRSNLFHPLAKNIQSFCDEFLNDNQRSVSNRLQIARLYELRASVNFVLKPDQSNLLADLRQADSIYREWSSSYGQDPEVDFRLACNHLAQGRLLVRYGSYESAQQLLDEALAGFQNLQKRDSLPKPHPELSQREAEVNHMLGELFLNQANITGREDQYRQSLEQFSQSRTLRERLVNEVNHTDRFNYESIRRDLARSYGYLGDLYLRRGRLQLAEDAYQKSLAQREVLHHDNPSDPEHRFQYARGLANFANVERIARRNLEQVIAKLEEAKVLQDALYKDFPDDPDFDVDLGWTLATLAEMHIFLAADCPAESRADKLNAARQYSQAACSTFSACEERDPQAMRGRAFSRALRAELVLDSDPESARRQAEEAEKCLRELASSTGGLGQDDYFTLALATALLGRTSDCLEALGTADFKGTTAAAQLQAHAEFGLTSVASSAEYKQQFHQMLDSVRSRISLVPSN
jgi:eukaryotic-like serine/threonine-protein kinase